MRRDGKSRLRGRPLDNNGQIELRVERLEPIADTPDDRPQPMSDAQRWELERHLERIKRDDAGNFPLIQALETALRHRRGGEMKRNLSNLNAPHVERLRRLTKRREHTTCALCGDTSAQMFLLSRCHPTAPLRVIKEGAVLVLRCYLPECDREVARLLLAEPKA